MTRPPHVTAALDRLAARTIEHSQLGVDLWIALRYIADLEEDNAACTAAAATVEQAGADLARLATRLHRALDGGPGDLLEIAIADEDGHLPAIALAEQSTPRRGS